MSEESMKNLIVVKKVVKARREEVYQAWVNPEIRRQWWRASDEYSPGLCETELAELVNENETRWFRN